MQKPFICVLLLVSVAYSSWSQHYNSDVYITQAGQATASVLMQQFDNIPDCSDPRDLTATDIQPDGFILHWQGKSAQPGEIEYVVRYRLVNAKEPWREKKVLNGTSAQILGLDKGAPYEVEVQKICLWKDGSRVPSKWIRTEVETLPVRIPLPPFTCGDSFPYPSYPCTSNDVIDDSTFQLSVIYIGGFPIEVESFSSHLDPENQLVWSGTGIVPLPFGESAVRVEWENVKINKDSNICAGIVLGLADDPMYYPNLDPGPVAFGGEICVPPPSAPGFDSNGIHTVTGLPYDEHGFGPTGTYDKQPPYPGYQPGMPYDTTKTFDPNGFDVDGNHALTGTPFNPAGCNREGFTAQGDTCDPNIPPYSWMDPNNPNPPTQAGLEFASEVEDSLSIWIQAVLNELNDSYEAKRDSQLAICTGIRDTMEALLTTLGYSREFIFGPDDNYFKVGMHQNFRAAPSKMLNDMVRNANVKTLENRHIDLYHCDKAQYVYQYYLDIIADYLGAGLTELTESILDKIKSMPQATIDQWEADPNLFEIWLAKEVEQAVKDEYTIQYGGGIGLLESEPELERLGFPRVPSRMYPATPASKTLTNFSSQALADNLNGELGKLLLAQALETRPEDIAFEFKQGFRIVNGVHRAYYLEGMANARRWKLTDWAVTANDSLLMPIEVTNRNSDGKQYKVYLDDIKFYTFKATLDAYIIIETPFDGQKLVFEAQDVEFTPKGPVVNPVKIELANDVYVRINNNARLKLLSNGNTYVAFDCLGFAGLGVEADVEVCRNVVLPYDPATDAILPDPQRVSGHFQIYLPNFSEFFVSLSIDPFAIPGAEDIKWIINGVALDLSESISPTGTPPLGYSTPFAGIGGFTPMWKGFYMDSLIVRLPKAFSKDTTPINVGVEDVVIDNMGVSGSVTASNILPLSAGSAGGWAFSIDQFELTVIMNQFSRAVFDGKVHVPIFRSASNDTGSLDSLDCMNYWARIDPGNVYSFELQPFTSNYAVDIWKAGTVVLDQGSAILLEYNNGEFTAIATLSGSAVVNSDLLPNVSINVPQIRFEGVEVSNQAPYFSPGHWEFPNQIGAKFAGFELTFTNIGMVATAEGDPALRFGAYVNIGGDTSKIKASGGFKIIGELITDDGRQRWKYKDFGVDELYISGGFGPVEHLNGTAVFFDNDETYGTGFRGGLGAKFVGIDASIQVVGQFGRMPSDYKYFMIDALYCGDIPLAGALSIKGLGGGVYNNMTRPDSLYGLPACSGLPIPSEIGASLSGIVYTPNDSVGLGFKFTAAVALSASERAFNANATFEVLFSDGGGLEKIWLYGNAQFMGDLNVSGLPTFVENAKPDNNAAISANLRLDMAFGGDGFVMNGQLEVYASIAGGIIRGAGANDKVVDASIHFEPGNWYIKIGSPTNRAGLKVVIPGFGNLADAQSYFQIGNDIEDIPPLPDEIAKLTGVAGVSPGFRAPEVSNGNGFAFGSDLQLGNKEFKFLIFYAGLYVRLGFDISVLDYGTGAICAGESEPIGINGWYASGQIYAGIEGKIGIQVKVFGKVKRFEILSIAAAAAMEAKLPNPFWARASIGVKYNVMGGLVKGAADFQVEIGEQCQIQGVDPFTNVPIIQATTPVAGASAVPVSIYPTVSFNFPINEAFTFEDLNDNKIEYKITLDSAKLMWRDWEIGTTRVWVSGQKHLTLKTGTYLPGKDTFTLIIKVHVDSAGVTIDNEERIVTFTTGPGLTYIPSNNVLGSYPLDGQYNFHKDQIADYKGYVQLDRGQPEVFFDKEEYVKVLRFRQSGGGCTYQLVDINSNSYWEKRIEFDIPASFFAPEQIYEMQLIEFPLSDPNWGEGFAGAAPCVGAPPVPSGGGTQQTQKAGDNSPPGPPPTPVPVEKVLYSVYFRTSAYNTFMEKLEDLDVFQTLGSAAKGGNPDLPEYIGPEEIANEFKVLTNIEPFDVYEVTYGVKLGAMPQQPFNGLANTWYGKMPAANVLGYFPDQGLEIGTDPIKWLGGIPDPFLGVNILNDGELPKVTKQNYLSGTFPATYASLVQKIHFYAPRILQDNYNALKAEAQAYAYSHMDNILEYFDCTSGEDVFYCLNVFCDAPGYTVYSKGFRKLVTECNLSIPTYEPTYPVKFEYRMPGWDQVTTTHYINLVHPE
ncbi:MAG: fibronectin type III domain-containing protein [Lewinellaceae bacterium]|nr:fibronectin type III domain-containing protein [Lewinellaceae bacterium]